MPRQRSDQPRQRRYEPLQALAYIARYKQQHNGRSPSQRQIQRELTISAPSVVHNMLHRLARRGLLTITTYGRGHTSDLLLTEAGHAAVARWQREQRAPGSGATGEQQ